MKLLNYEAVAYLVGKTKEFCLDNVNNHSHSAADIESGTLGVAHGGTGGATAEEARSTLSVYSVEEVDAKLGEVGAVLEALTGVSA